MCTDPRSLIHGLGLRQATISSLVAAALIAGCNGSSPPASTVPAADRARAVSITDPAQLIGGPKASGRVGDILLANTKVRFIIEASGRSRSWFPVAGALLDADLVRPPGGSGGEDRLQEMVTRIGNLSVLEAQTVEIAADGADGNAAIVRVTGYDIPVPILQSVTQQRRVDVKAVTEYRLSPYDESLEISTTVTDQSGADQTIPAGDMFVLGDYVDLFAPGVGTNRDNLTLVKDLRYFSAFGGPVSYGYSAPGRKMVLLVPQAEIFGAGTDNLVLAANGSATFSRRLAIGSGDVSSLLPEIIKREGGAAPVIVDGKVSEAKSAGAVPGSWVTFSNGAGPYSISVVGKDGSFHAPLEPGTYSYSASATSRAASPAAQLTIATTAPAPLDVKLADTGRFALAIVDGNKSPLPARVQIRGKDGSDHGYFLSADGKGGGELPPSDYVAIASRGYEYEFAQAAFTIIAGQTVNVPLSVIRVVDTVGYAAVDSHTHTAISVDSQLDPHERVAQALGDGVDLVITTDHDVIFDLKPTIAEVTTAAPLATVMGCEVSPVPGHINGFPAIVGPANDTDGYWPVEWWTEDMDKVFIADLWPRDIFAAVRSRLGATLVQVNHPRSSQGVLTWVGYNVAKGLKSVDAAKFDMNWDLIEICNAGCNGNSDSENGKTQRDWYSFLNQGYARTAVGVSDSHVSSNFLGRARTMVAVRDDDPANLDTNELFTAMKAGNAVVMDGPFVVATVKDDSGKEVQLGGLAKATQPKVTLHVRVQAPSWIATDRIRVVQNGVEVTAVPVVTMNAPVVRFDADIVLDGTPADAWYAVIVEGDAAMRPVLDAAPRSVTNAIYVDRNGNGAFEAPGL